MALEPCVVRQVRGRLVVEVDDRTEIDGGAIDLLVLAELLVTSLQVGKIEATQHLGALDRLRIVHSGRDQVIDIDVLELKCLEHIGAARMQDLGDQRLIALPVEFRPDGARRGRDLAQGHGGGENLDEECFHLTLRWLRETQFQTAGFGQLQPGVDMVTSGVNLS